MVFSGRPQRAGQYPPAGGLLNGQRRRRGLRVRLEVAACDYNVGMPTTTRIVRIGNSRGIRIPKALLELADLSDEVELHAEPGRLVVRATRRPREGWEAAAQEMRAAGDDLLLDPPRPTAFDGEEWDW